MYSLVFHEDEVEYAVKYGVYQVCQSEVENEKICNSSHPPVSWKHISQLSRAGKLLVHKWYWSFREPLLIHIIFNASYSDSLNIDNMSFNSGVVWSKMRSDNSIIIINRKFYVTYFHKQKWINRYFPSLIFVIYFLVYFQMDHGSRHHFTFYEFDVV